MIGVQSNLVASTFTNEAALSRISLRSRNKRSIPAVWNLIPNNGTRKLSRGTKVFQPEETKRKGVIKEGGQWGIVREK